MIDAIFAILLGLRIATNDTAHEDLDDHLLRMRTIAAAIETAANRAACFEQLQPCRAIIGDRYVAAAALLVQASAESQGMRLDVQLGECRRGECDHGRARGLWQLHRPPTVDRDWWLGYAGLSRDSLDRAAWRNITLWIGGARGGRSFACGFARLAGLRNCAWLEAEVRAREVWRVYWLLRGTSKQQNCHTHSPVSNTPAP